MLWVLQIWEPCIAGCPGVVFVLNTLNIFREIFQNRASAGDRGTDDQICSIVVLQVKSISFKKEGGRLLELEHSTII